MEGGSSWSLYHRSGNKDSIQRRQPKKQAVMSCWPRTQTLVMTSNTTCLKCDQLLLLITTHRGFSFSCYKVNVWKGGQNGVLLAKKHYWDSKVLQEGPKPAIKQQVLHVQPDIPLCHRDLCSTKTHQCATVLHTKKTKYLSALFRYLRLQWGISSLGHRLTVEVMRVTDWNTGFWLLEGVVDKRKKIWTALCFRGKKETWQQFGSFSIRHSVKGAWTEEALLGSVLADVTTAAEEKE